MTGLQVTDTTVTTFPPLSFQAPPGIQKLNNTHWVVAPQFTIPVGNQNISIQVGSTLLSNITRYNCENVPSNINLQLKADPKDRYVILNRRVPFMVTGLKKNKFIDGTLICSVPGVDKFNCIVTQFINHQTNMFGFTLYENTPFNLTNSYSPGQITISDSTNPSLSITITVGSILPPLNILQSVNSSNVAVEYYPIGDIKVQAYQNINFAINLSVKNLLSTSVFPFIFFKNIFYRTGYSAIFPISGNSKETIFVTTLGSTRKNSVGSATYSNELYIFNGSTSDLVSTTTLSLTLDKMIINNASNMGIANSKINDNLFIMDLYANQVNVIDSITPTFEIAKLYGGVPMTFDFPLGYNKGDINSYKFGFSSVQSAYLGAISPAKLKLLDNEVSISIPVYNANTEDKIQPVLKNIRYEQLNATHCYMFIHASDVGSGILSIDISGQESITSRDLVSGTINDGQYEKIIEYYPTFSISLVDRAYNRLSLAKVYSNFEPIPINPISKYFWDNPFTAFNITRIKFQKNDVDVSNEGTWNRIEIEISKVTPNSNGDSEFYKEWTPTISLNLDSNVNKPLYKGSWNSTLNCFTIDFYILAKTYSGPIQYLLRIQQYLINYDDILGSLGDKAELRVHSDIADQGPPVITTVTLLNSESVSINSSSTTAQFGWRITVEDDYNGIDSVEFTVRSTLDPLPFKFSFSGPPDGVTVTGNQFKRFYLVQIQESLPCKSQTYQITDIILRDKQGYTSVHSRENRFPGFFDIKYFSMPTLQQKISLTCDSSFSETQFPDIVSFDFNPKTIDVGSPLDSDRIVTFKLTASSSNPISQRHSPTIYLSYGIGTSSFIKVPFNQTVGSQNGNKQVSYQVSTIIPRSISVDSPILVSLYGITDKSLRFNGHSTYFLQYNKFPGTLLTTYTRYPILRYSLPRVVSSNDKSITLYGQNFQVGTSILQIDYRDGKGYNTIPVESMTGLRCSTNGIKQGYNTYRLRVVTGDLVSNELTIATYYVPLPTPSPESRCRGDPLCGGPNQGYCDETVGCICKDPWYGFNCQSQIINTTKPDPNTDTPDTNTNGTLPNGDNVSFSSLISMVSLREIGVLSDQPIKTHNFSIWYMENLSDTSKGTTLYQYKTNITNIVGDESFNTSVMTVSSMESQTLVGINIRHYSESVLLDPDFSIVVDYTKPDKSISTCSKSGLTKSQLAGIIVGCGVAFIAIVVVEEAANKDQLEMLVYLLEVQKYPLTGKLLNSNPRIIDYLYQSHREAFLQLRIQNKHLENCFHGDIELAKLLIDQQLVTISQGIVKNCVILGYLNILSYLLGFIQTETDFIKELIKLAFFYGHKNVIEYLLSTKSKTKLSQELHNENVMAGSEGWKIIIEKKEEDFRSCQIGVPLSKLSFNQITEMEETIKSMQFKEVFREFNMALKSSDMTIIQYYHESGLLYSNMYQPWKVVDFTKCESPLKLYLLEIIYPFIKTPHCQKEAVDWSKVMNPLLLLGMVQTAVYLLQKNFFLCAKGSNNFTFLEDLFHRKYNGRELLLDDNAF
eukprot:gene926-1169_t